MKKQGSGNEDKEDEESNCVTHFCAKNPGQKRGKTRLSGLAV